MSGKKVLIVDDTKTYRVLIAGIMRKLGCEIVGEAEDGEQAVEMYKQLAPDLVMLDIEMPNIHGVAALKAIKAHDANAKVIMCTTVDNYDVIDDCLMAGAIDYIRKDRLEEIPDRVGPYIG